MAVEDAYVNSIIIRGAALPSNQAIEFFGKHQREADSWPQDYRRRFYFQWGVKVCHALGREAAYPFYVHSLAVERPVNKLNGAWAQFGFYVSDENKTEKFIKELLKKYPLTQKYIDKCIKDANKTHIATVTRVMQLVAPETNQVDNFAYALLEDGKEICVQLPFDDSECDLLKKLIPENKLKIEVHCDRDWILKRIMKE